ncbi:regulator of telomere elongation helicase 1 [Vairimorpha apis BRL 01]|uniref:Regulator of telomere elongation helicase 1 n=1 Tax=Vairimorpha apis BRL 01 TaxID=1037528 RepID=T0L2A4_9MICR|nr:regulator of telomere elongation helicase 1 [Vairimorpha apis BRL 01]
MARIKIKDVTIDMPFEPYKSQIDTMEQIITCLSEGSTGMIESPTGTGKSLSILCSVLAYREHLKRIKIDTNISKKICSSQNDTGLNSSNNKSNCNKIIINDFADNTLLNVDNIDINDEKNICDNNGITEN